MLLRDAVPEDAMAVAGVHVRSWQTAYRKLLPDDYLDRLRPEERAARYDFASLDPCAPRTIVAATGNLIQGFATISPSRDADLKGYGELCALYVDPEYWGLGIGAALISAARGRLLERGFRNAFLWVLVGNVRAERFYRIDGWTADGSHRTDSIWGSALVNEMRYQRILGAEARSPGKASARQ